MGQPDINQSSWGWISRMQSGHIAISMTERGDPYENALAERMNGIIKGEFDLYSSQVSFEQTGSRIDSSIKAYNELRPHGSCDYLMPGASAKKCIEKAMEGLSRQMAAGKAAGHSRLKTKLSTKTGGPGKKKKRSNKRQTVIEYGKLKKFPTFNNRQTNNKATIDYL